MQNHIARVALITPVRRLFDYLIPNENQPTLEAGMRVRVPFARGHKVGLVVEVTSQSEWTLAKLKAISDVLDDSPLFDTVNMQIRHWLGEYYMAPPGEAYMNLLPKKLKAGEPALLPSIEKWQANVDGKLLVTNQAKRQLALLDWMGQRQVSLVEVKQAGFSRDLLNKLQESQAISRVELRPEGSISKQVNYRDLGLTLLDEQQAAINRITAQLNQFKAILLQGVTGSGKTEVYIQAMAKALQQNQQVLVLVPEIGLTPQTLQRFAERFDSEIVVLHSELNDTERYLAWLKAKMGLARIVVGTRSAVLAPMPDLGLIILDEEHDISFKQQDSLRYNARDVAVKRAHLQQVPIVLGSATPSLESYYNAIQGRYLHLKLQQRAQQSQPPQPVVLDIKDQPLQDGLAPRVLDLMAKHLDAGNQVLVFLNRRGFAPALMCHECGWIYECQRCDHHFTYHQSPRQAQCHQCGEITPVPRQCHSCGSTQIIDWGVGTEKLEAFLKQRFEKTPPLRVDRDNIRGKGQLAQTLHEVKQGEHQLLIGTQMLAKGHHFPNLTLTVIVNLDNALYSADFRAIERMSQLLVQVAGRAGRGDKPGQVVLQSHHPEHSVINLVCQQNYEAVLSYLLQERQAMMLPPYQFWAVLRAEAHQPALVEQFCAQVTELLKPYLQHHYQQVILLPAFPAAQEKRAGKYRYLMVFESKQRNQLNAALKQLCQLIEAQKGLSQVRWLLDIDPQDIC
ncbi:primosomal protein N' [Saccharobesus litoralis]|uniref:Replication restart protein PriA n=1 Tax=Saccharobesus litoralis TaxID=2172099 RepID=A0A2S0VX92_9ALTE|nr:primosomal protein N' [Saccharobesus litoralis]AWB66345.1 primosomal protein N' [Saccharobesus litoralis]AWB68847.1 primosomal protein N' [Saccharobesus litoralis]